MATVLVVGASGLVGTAAANSFIAAGWDVIAASRRFPELIQGTFTHVSLDLQDQGACQRFASSRSDLTHVVYTAVFELPGLIAGWSDPVQIKTNDQMLRNLIEPLVTHNNIQHITLLQGTKAYGGAVQPMRVPARESQARIEHPNFYWLQEDYLRDKSVSAQFTLTILRPQLIVGPNHGVVMNLPPVIGAYAALRHEAGELFSFPGGADWVWEAVDARLVGDACLWAATNKVSHGETYNLTNGEVFLWRDMWPEIAKALGVEIGPDEPTDIAKYMEEKEEVWAELVQKYGLEPTTLKEIVGESHHYANLCFGYGSTVSPPPTYVSTVKIKQAGFTETYDSELSFCHWLGDLQDRKIIPTF
ncbi:MAG: NAD-dependent epimerase/dehydratase family protein [Pseudomonadales bacterium]|nr:NAD-dependent epimerase/dehydratase family protein [Pseudomonadales bacterium]